MADDKLFLTELLGLKVFDLKGRRIGVVKDAAIVPLVDPVRVDRFLMGSGSAWFKVRYDQVRSISLDGRFFLRDEILTPHHSDEYMLRVVRDLLDQQIIDAQGRKVVRVTDITLEGSPGSRVSGAVGAGRGRRHPQRCRAGWCRAWFLQRVGCGSSNRASRRAPSAGNSATSWSPIRSAACA